MTWNYRVMARKWEGGDVMYGIHEVYYRDDGVIYAWTANPMTGWFDTVHDLKESLFLMLDAFNKQVLDEEALEELVAQRKD